MQRIMKRSLGVAVGLWALSQPVLAQNQPIRALEASADAPAVTLQEAVKTALAENEDVRVAEENTLQQRIGVLEAWSFLLPTWTVSGQKQYNAIEQTVEFQSEEQLENQALLYDAIAEIMEQNAAVVPDPSAQEELRAQASDLRDVSTELRGTEVEPTIITPREIINADTTIRMPLFNGRALPMLANAYSRADVAILAQEQVLQSIAQATIMAYYLAWLNEENWESAKRQLLRTEEHVAATQRRVDAGILPLSNLHRARLDAIQAAQSVQEAENRFAQSKGALGFLMAREKDFTLRAPEPMSDKALEPERALVERALVQRPDLKIQRVMLVMSERLRSDAWLRFLPSFNLVAQTRYTDNLSGFVNDPFISSVALQGTVTLFEGGQRYAAVRSSASKIRQEKTKLEKLKRDVRAQFRALLETSKPRKFTPKPSKPRPWRRRPATTWLTFK